MRERLSRRMPPPFVQTIVEEVVPRTVLGRTAARQGSFRGREATAGATAKAHEKHALC
jgi:hypothetical protein